MKLDLHTHTNHSKCSDLPPWKSKKIFEKLGIVPAITDHNKISGAIEYRKLGGKCIIGEEITTKQGEIIGLFLSRRIKPGMRVVKTVQEIKKQGGIVMLQHPFDRLRKSRLSRAGMQKIIKDVDIVEVFNGRTMYTEDNKKALKFAKKFGKPMVACSDGHFAGEVGKSYTFGKSLDKKDFLKNLSGRMVNKKASILVHVKSKLRKWLR